MEGYRIVDEPRPSAHAELSVNPFFILLAVMLGGVWLAWPWFVFNSLAIGSATLRREVALVIAGFVGSGALIGLGARLVAGGVIDERTLPYAFLVLVVWKLAVSYVVLTNQARSHQLHEYFGGPTKNGMWVVLLGFFARRTVLGALGGVWLMILA
jgi:hypothetical protein